MTRSSGDEVGSYRELSRGPPIQQSRTISHSQSQRLWPVSVVEEGKEKVKIHYIGWSHKHDEWRKKGDICNLMNPQAQSSLMITQLKIQIKEQLYGASKRDSHRIIRIPASESDFNELASTGRIYKQTKTKNVRNITSRQCLERVLGTAWDYRIVNEEGDNFFAKTCTVRFHLAHRQPLKEYVLFPDHVEVASQDRGTILVFSVVVCKSNKSIFTCLLNNDEL